LAAPLYVDTSALLDRVFGQKNHTAIAAAMREQAEQEGRMVASRLLHLEARRAYVRERLAGHDVGALPILAAEIRPLPLTNEVWAEADAIEQHAKALDAIHLATCKLVGGTLLATDSNMLRVARSMGLEVHPASQPG
jgi:uncharacterized protein